MTGGGPPVLYVLRRLQMETSPPPAPAAHGFARVVPLDLTGVRSPLQTVHSVARISSTYHRSTVIVLSVVLKGDDRLLQRYVRTAYSMIDPMMQSLIDRIPVPSLYQLSSGGPVMWWLLSCNLLLASSPLEMLLHSL
jgi:hypothetical protein